MKSLQCRKSVLSNTVRVGIENVDVVVLGDSESRRSGSSLDAPGRLQVEQRDQEVLGE